MKPKQKNSECPATASNRDPQSVQTFLQRATQGDPSILPLVKELLAEPASVPLVEEFGNLALKVEGALVGACAGTNLMTQEAMRLKLAALRTELAGPEPAPLEKLLVERVVLCWLQVHHADACFINSQAAPFPQRDFYQRLQDRSQARYLAAIKVLATIRKLLRPALSPLDLATRPVSETPVGGAHRFGNMLAAGVPVVPVVN